MNESRNERESSGIVTCVVCGHTEDPATARERWAFRPVAEQWMCDECWADEKDFPEFATAMRDCTEHCPDCDAEKTAELVVAATGERLHLYCTNADCDRSRYL